MHDILLFYGDSQGRCKLRNEDCLYYLSCGSAIARRSPFVA